LPMFMATTMPHRVAAATAGQAVSARLVPCISYRPASCRIGGKCGNRQAGPR
jgi:hypothetical protein